MNGVRKVSNVFYKLAKIFQIIGVIAWALVSVFYIIAGTVGIIGTLVANEGVEEVIGGHIAVLCMGLFVYPVITVCGIIALVLLKKARGSNNKKDHIAALVFDVLSGSGFCGTVGAILALVYLSKGNTFDSGDTRDFEWVEKAEEKAKAKKAAKDASKTVDAKPVEEEKPDEPNAE